MRPLTLSLLVAVVACSGNSLKVGSDDSGSGGDAGDGGTNAGGGSGKGGSSGSAAGGAAGATPTSGSTNGGTGSGAVPSGGTSGDGSSGVPNGGTSAGEMPTGGTSTGGSGAMPSITSCSEEFPFVGVWDGSVLDFYFEPMEDLRLVVVANEELGGYEATLTVGTGDPPPVGDPDEPYPSLEFWQGVDGTGGAHSVEIWPGFAYSAVRGAGCDQVFRLSVSLAEPWEGWCSAQEPVYTSGTGWGCTYRGGGSADGATCDVQDGRGNVLASYPLWKCYSCGAFGAGVCACTEDACGANPELLQTFDLKRGTSGGVEVLSGPDPRCGDCTVRLERVE